MWHQAIFTKIRYSDIDGGEHFVHWISDKLYSMLLSSSLQCFIYHIDKGLQQNNVSRFSNVALIHRRDSFSQTEWSVGLIIDAFGELRDREDSISADMKNKCFVCGLPKAEFDHVPHSFDNHVTREHNAAHYM